MASEAEPLFFLRKYLEYNYKTATAHWLHRMVPKMASLLTINTQENVKEMDPFLLCYLKGVIHKPRGQLRGEGVSQMTTL